MIGGRAAYPPTLSPSDIGLVGFGRRPPSPLSMGISVAFSLHEAEIFLGGGIGGILSNPPVMA